MYSSSHHEARGPKKTAVGDQGATALVAGGEQTRGRGEAVLARPFDWRPTGGGKHRSSRALALGRREPAVHLSQPAVYDPRAR